MCTSPFSPTHLVDEDAHHRSLQHRGRRLLAAHRRLLEQQLHRRQAAHQGSRHKYGAVAGGGPAWAAVEWRREAPAAEPGYPAGWGSADCITAPCKRRLLQPIRVEGTHLMLPGDTAAYTSRGSGSNSPSSVGEGRAGKGQVSRRRQHAVQAGCRPDMRLAAEQAQPLQTCMLRQLGLHFAPKADKCTPAPTFSAAVVLQGLGQHQVIQRLARIGRLLVHAVPGGHEGAPRQRRLDAGEREGQTLRQGVAGRCIGCMLWVQLSCCTAAERRLPPRPSNSCTPKIV